MLAESMRENGPPDPTTAATFVARATGAHEAGRLDEAKAAYIAALQVNPYSPEAEHGLAWLHAQQGDWLAAMPRFARAIRLRPWEPEFWLSQIEALFVVGQDEAVHRLLHRAKQAGLPDERIIAFEHRLRERRLDALAQRVKASGRCSAKASQAPMPELLALREPFLKRRFAEAQEGAADLVRRYPLCAFGWRVLGASQAASGAPEASLEALRIACDLDPDSVDVRMNLALALHDLGRLDEAEASYRAILAVQPTNVRALVNIGLLLNARNDPGAETMLREARRLGAADHRVALALGAYLRDRDELKEALPLLEEAMAADPANHACLSALAVCYLGLGRHEQAAALFRRLRDTGTLHLGALDIALFVGSHVAEIGPEELFALHRRYGDLVEASVVPHAFWDNNRDPDRRFRVGFVSGDLRQHAMANFVTPLWQGLDRSRVEVFAYSNHRTNDEVTARLRALTDGWCDIVGMSDEMAANRVRQDRIDVLVDLSGHTGFNRLGVFAFKPAPVQISWGGYPATTGLSRMDYYVADVFWAPPGTMDDQVTEKLLLNPGTSIFHPEDPSPHVGPAPCIRNSFVTFGSFNRMNKINPATIRLWSRVLRRVPDSRMVIGATDGDSAERLRAQFFEHGVDPSRIRFFPRSPVYEYLQRQTDVDINLDAMPYTGGTTTYHALWMGVPTLTLAGKTLPARGGCSIMRGAGLAPFVAESEEEFVDRAVHWASPSQRDALAAIRASTRNIMCRTMIGRTAPAIQGFEDGIRWAWSQWCKGLPPRAYIIPPRA